MESEFCYHIKSILSTKGRRELSLLKEVISPIVLGEENQVILVTTSESEIKDVVLQLGSLKSLGPDGILAKSYQHMWEDIGLDIINFTQVFFGRYSPSKILIELL